MSLKWKVVCLVSVVFFNVSLAGAAWREVRGFTKDQCQTRLEVNFAGLGTTKTKQHYYPVAVRYINNPPVQMAQIFQFSTDYVDAFTLPTGLFSIPGFSTSQLFTELRSIPATDFRFEITLSELSGKRGVDAQLLLFGIDDNGNPTTSRLPIKPDRAYLQQNCGPRDYRGRR